MIGSRVATHVLSATICLSQDAECFSRKKPGTARASASETKRDESRDTLWSRPSLLDCLLEIEMGYQSLVTQACILSHHHTAKNVWKSRSKNQQESEKVAAIFVRKSREKIATRYTNALRRGASGNCRGGSIVSTASRPCVSIQGRHCRRKQLAQKHPLARWALIRIARSGPRTEI